MNRRIGIAFVGLAVTTSACSIQTSFPELYNDHYYWAGRQQIDIGQPERAEEYFLKAAGNGDYEAMAYLGTMYARGIGVESDTAKSLMWYEKAVQDPSGKHDRYAKTVGDIYGRSDGEFYDAAKAEKFWAIAIRLYEGKQSLQTNDVMILASMYARGQGTPANAQAALDLIESHDGAEIGTLARLAGDIEYNGLGKPVDMASALRWYTLADEAGDIERLRQLGDIYAKGVSVNVDMEKANGYYTRYIAYHEGGLAEDAFVHPSIKRNLAHMYANGLGGKADGEKAISLLEGIADEENGLNARIIGDIYYAGEGLNKPDKSKALGWYLKSVELGSNTRLSRLGTMYANGEGIAANLAKANQYWAQAAANLEELGDQRSQWENRVLASLYVSGHGVERQYDRAMALYEVGASVGDASSARLGGDVAYDNGDFETARRLYAVAVANDSYQRAGRYADMLAAGVGGPKDPNGAMTAYTIYAEQLENDPITKPYSKLRLGHLYQSGKLGSPDIQKALITYKSVADKLPVAAIEVGDLYYSGALGNKDFSEAATWYHKALDMGNTGRVARLIYMYEQGQGVEKNASKVKELQAEIGA
jgi:TPR repeat protein